MSSLLARFAANTYWLGRYLERVESIARIIDINETYARDNPEGTTWQSVLDLYADTERFCEIYERVDAESVLDFYILNKSNPTSIISAVASARENARTIRHLISTEMWTHLNIFHYRVSGFTKRDIWTTHLTQLCSDIKLNCQTFEGIAEGTFFRGEAWCFYHLGKYIERADQTTRILDIGYDQLIGEGEESEARLSTHKDVLLRSVAGYHAFRTNFPTSSSPRDIATFMIYDEQFPRAVTSCANQIAYRIRDLERRHGHRRDAGLEKAQRNLAFSLETGLGNRITSDRLHRFLDRLQIALGQVSDAIAKAYFE